MDPCREGVASVRSLGDVSGEMISSGDFVCSRRTGELAVNTKCPRLNRSRNLYRVEKSTSRVSSSFLARDKRQLYTATRQFIHHISCFVPNVQHAGSHLDHPPG